MPAGSNLPLVRAAETRDIPRLVPMINAAFAVETFLEGTRTDETRLAAMMEKGAIFVAESLGGRLIASVYTELRGNRGYLGMLAVEPAQQGHGLARRLLAACEEHFRGLGCDAIEITVLNLRQELPAIYKRFGFVETGTEEFRSPQRLKEGLDCHCIVMTKRL